MAAKKQTKIFVLDTNVILHDHTCIYQFQDNDIVIPITVLEELDKFKRGNDPINFQAREFVRELDDIIGDKLFNGGIKLGPDKGHLMVEKGKPFTEELKQSFREDIPDHRILAITIYITKKFPTRQCILVTKDINLRMKAKSLKIQSEDYYNDKVKDIEILNKSVTELDNFDDAIIEKLYNETTVPIELMGLEKTPDANEYFILKSTKGSVLGRYDGATKRMGRVEKRVAYGIKPRNGEQTFSLDALCNP